MQIPRSKNASALTQRHIAVKCLLLKIDGKMNLNLYQIDAFADRVFAGNPAAVCPLETWLEDEVMQAIAAENNVAETAFYVPCGDDFEIRWFTPTVEVDLCGHATLASAYVLYEEQGFDQPSLRFHSKSGILQVSKKGNLFELDFPTQECEPCAIPEGMAAALGVKSDIIECLGSDDYLVVLDTEQELMGLEPDFPELGKLQARGIIVTAASKQYDFVNRFFGPNVGINEDPVTGSAFTKLIPYWAKKLEKEVLTAKQVSPRGGEVFCQLLGDRVLISGHAKKYMQGMIEI